MWVFQDVLRGLDSFISQRPPLDFSALAPESQDRQILFGVFVCAQVMVFGVAWLRIWRAHWKHTTGETHGLMLGGVLVTAAVFFTGQIFPFRILYHNASERVSYQSQRCYLVGTRGEDARLFCPAQPPLVRPVKLGDPALTREGVLENIFVGLGTRNRVQ
jgi:hypothetical protein